MDALWRSAYRIAFRLQKLWWRVRRPRLTGAYVAVWREGRVLCIRNSYRRLLSLPAGGLARGERPIDAAIRELMEEVAIAVDAAELRYVGEIVSHVGHAEDHAHFFELHREEEVSYAVDRREVVRAEFLAPAVALERGVVDVVRQYLERHAPVARECDALAPPA